MNVFKQSTRGSTRVPCCDMTYISLGTGLWNYFLFGQISKHNNIAQDDSWLSIIQNSFKEHYFVIAPKGNII